MTSQVYACALQSSGLGLFAFEVCGVIKCGTVRSVCSSMHDVHHAIVEVNVVIGVLVVHCELLVVRVVPVVVCDDAVVRRTLVLIAFIVAFVFVVAILHRILLYWRYIVYRSWNVTLAA